MTESAKKLAKKLGAKLLKKNAGKSAKIPSVSFTLGSIVGHIKRNWVEVEDKTIKISGLQTRSL